MAFLLSSSSFFKHPQQQQLMLSLVFFFFSIFSMCFLFVLLYKRLRRAKEDESIPNPLSIFKCSISSTINRIHQNHKTHPLYLEILTSNSPKLGSSSSPISDFDSNLSVVDNGEEVSDERIFDGSELDKDDDCRKSGGEEGGGKKKKKRGKKKRNHNSDGGGGGEGEGEDGTSDLLGSQHDKHHCLNCSYPFTSSSSITQKKIKQQYDQLIKSHDSKALTMAQVGQFVNCLIEARNELQHKSEIIQRKFTITKALLLKADRSSFDRHSQQIYKLEAEQKRLEEDTGVYNRLQQQLKLSPAYKKMLEIGERMELKATSGQLVDSMDTDFAGISFEELLAQEKKDTFWQKNGKLRSCMH